MWCVPKDEYARNAGIQWHIEKALQTSRFRAELEQSSFRSWNSHIWGTKISVIRLRQSKDYCGQHPGPCLVSPIFGAKPHRHSRCLEGLDWVGWNEGLNDLFDRLGLSVDVFSWNREAARWSEKKQAPVSPGKYYIRKGRCRRVDYDQLTEMRYGRLVVAWDAKGTFADYCGKTAPPARYPEDTPGTACWAADSPLLLGVTHG